MSRFDDIGMFWEDLPSTGKRGDIIRPMPPIPETGWTTPTHFPDLSAASVISLDTETYDPELLDNGPGWARGVGHIVGISVAVDPQNKWYFPMRHEIEPEYNMDPEKVLAWARDTFKNPRQPKIGANLGYDIGWLKHEGVEVAGELVDVQFAEALLDESARVALDILAEKYLGEGKETEFIYRWCSDFYGGAINDKQRKNLYRTPPRLAGPYAESDADLPLRLAPILYQHLVDENLLDLFRMENKLIPLLTEMRFAGVTVDIDKAEQVREDLILTADKLQGQLDHMVGFDVNVNASGSLAMAFDEIGLKYPQTKKGNPSFTKAFLGGVSHPVGELIREIRKVNKMRGTFVEGYILDSNINGKVYGQFHSMRGEGGGTRSGRFSSSTPNLQNIPSRDDVLAPLIRGMYTFDEGHVAWRKYDYSQIEYRCLIHDAVGQAGEDVRAMFNADPSIDYHDFTQNLIHEQIGVWIDRKPIKNINFGLIYGMGVSALCDGMGLSKKEGTSLVKSYHEGVPFAKATMDHYMELAQSTGYVQTILGRKSRFETWEPAKWTKDAIPLPYERAILKWGNIVRAQTHKALNRRLQGSAADMMKMAMIQCYEDGVFDYIGVPRLTVHDELDFSDPGGVDDGFKEMQRIMETALPLKIPVKADGEIGPDWGHVKDIE